MRPVPISQEQLPENMVAAKFSPPPGLEEEMNEAVGVIHLDPETKEKRLLEFMFEVTQDEIDVLQKRPFITIAIFADHLHPFSIQTSYPAEEQDRQHSHHCPKCEVWHICDDPRHRPKEIKQDRYLLCANCLGVPRVEVEEEGSSSEAEVSAVSSDDGVRAQEDPESSDRAG